MGQSEGLRRDHGSSPKLSEEAFFTGFHKVANKHEELGLVPDPQGLFIRSRVSLVSISHSIQILKASSKLLLKEL